MLPRPLFFRSPICMQVTSLIARAQANIARMPAERMPPPALAKPLIRLKVEHSGYHTLPNARCVVGGGDMRAMTIVCRYVCVVSSHMIYLLHAPSSLGSLPAFCMQLWLRVCGHRGQPQRHPAVLESAQATVGGTKAGFQVCAPASDLTMVLD